MNFLLVSSLAEENAMNLSSQLKRVVMGAVLVGAVFVDEVCIVRKVDKAGVNSDVSGVLSVGVVGVVNEVEIDLIARDCDLLDFLYCQAAEHAAVVTVCNDVLVKANRAQRQEVNGSH